MLWCKIAKLILFLLVLTVVAQANEFFQTQNGIFAGDCGCTFQGDPVVTMLDGNEFTLPVDPNGDRRFAMTLDNNFELWPCLFNAELKISPVPNADSFSSRVKSIEGHVGFKGEFRMDNTGHVSIGFGSDRKDVTVPSDGSRINVVANPSDSKADHLVFRVWKNELGFVWLRSLNCSNFAVFYNGRNEGGVVLDKAFHGSNVMGICGNCNGDKSDDFKKSDGFMTNDTVEFAESWIRI